MASGISRNAVKLLDRLFSRRSDEIWPTVSEELVVFLMKAYPARTIRPDEDVAAHVRYAGMVDLIEVLKEHSPLQRRLPDEIAKMVTVETGDFAFTEAEEEAIQSEDAMDMALRTLDRQQEG